jgi:hypothetical protein
MFQTLRWLPMNFNAFFLLGINISSRPTWRFSVLRHNNPSTAFLEEMTTLNQYSCEKESLPLTFHSRWKINCNSCRCRWVFKFIIHSDTLTILQCTEAGSTYRIEGPYTAPRNKEISEPSKKHKRMRFKDDSREIEDKRTRWVQRSQNLHVVQGLWLKVDKSSVKSFVMLRRIDWYKYLSTFRKFVVSSSSRSSSPRRVDEGTAILRNLGHFYQSTRRHIPEDLKLQLCPCESYRFWKYKDFLNTVIQETVNELRKQFLRNDIFMLF